ncbi:MAG: hypothetical protein IIC31_11745 [Chloroflexi bacterium]|nr:hypothetical protein [Chloroflexota bacterium]
MAPEPFRRASSNLQFANAFITRMQRALAGREANVINADYVEAETFKPVKVALWYEGIQRRHLWRTFSFASLNSADQQLTAAKAIHAENVDLMSLPKYENSDLAIAVQMPKPDERSAWDDVIDWLDRTSHQVEVFHDRLSIDEKAPELAVA